jgi:murein DD-endopeptidase MepM/ murein hydrolase activator NlpD
VAAFKGGKPEVLWNAKPRFGKTLTTYDPMRALDVQKVLIVTNRPTIANAWYDDFTQFIGHQTTFQFVSESPSLDGRSPMTREQWRAYSLAHQDDNPRIVEFVSLQDLKGSQYFGGSYDKLRHIAQFDWDLLVIDEAHEGIDTTKTDVAFDQIKRKWTLHLSGTPFKALAKGKFEQDQIFNWTYEDERVARQNWTPEDGENPYAALPTLNLLTYQISRMITDRLAEGVAIAEDEANIDFAFNLNEFFATKDNSYFEHEADVEKFLDCMTTNEKYPFSTPELRDEIRHSFWLLNRVASAKALERMLKKHEVFKDYTIVLAAGDGRPNDDDADPVAAGKSLDKVRQAIAEAEKAGGKTITLSVGQLTTGVTVPEWTAVIMLSDLSSPAQYMQAAFRAQNPCTFERGGQVFQKQNAYIFDFAPERTLTIFDAFANNLHPNASGDPAARKENIRTLLNFQQRDAWGSLAARMNVATSARMFFTGGAAGQRGLLDVPGWQSMSIAAAAQAVQVSAFPSAYAQWESLAVATVNALAEVDLAADCGTAATGAWVPPVPDGYTITARFGDCGGRWSDCHTGTDFAIASGTPVHAAASGVVAFVGWGGAYGNLIQITHVDRTETWYAHLSAATVQLGTRIDAGTVIGTVGSTGNTTGPHLHFEVRVADRHVDSWRWLQERVGARPQVAGGSPTYTIATFNLLGHSHTVSGGNKPGYAPSPVRTRWAIRLLNRRGVDVVGLQEFQAPQHRAFTAAARGSWRVFPGPGPHNAIAWRRTAFDLVATDTVAIPYFDGQRVRMPIVRLRHRATGQQLILLNVHNPADTRAHPNQGRWRAIAKRREITLAHKLLRNHRLPVFVVGDMNEKQSYFCDITEPGALVSAAGGSNHGACAPPRPTLIDQIYGPASVRFHGYTVNHRTLGRISDHPLILTRVG